MMRLTEAVELIKELEVKILKNTEEMDMIIDLMDMPKYYASKTLTERFQKLERKTKKLIEERSHYIKQVELYDSQITIKEYK